jgi:hypothetical protein
MHEQVVAGLRQTITAIPERNQQRSHVLRRSRIAHIARVRRAATGLAQMLRNRLFGPIDADAGNAKLLHPLRDRGRSAEECESVVAGSVVAD